MNIFINDTRTILGEKTMKVQEQTLYQQLKTLALQGGMSTNCGEQ